MKRIRFIRLAALTLLTLITLLLAIMPALAAEPFYNISFEFDRNHDGTPDYWHVNGEILYLCNPSFHVPDGECVMAILPSERRAALYISGVDPYDFYDEELGTRGHTDATLAARNLAENRVFLGVIVEFPADDPIAMYGPVPGGNYKWMFYSVERQRNLPTVPSSAKLGFLVLPGNGYLVIDSIYWVWFQAFV